MTYANTNEREQLITGLRELAAYFESHPDVPAPRYGDAIVMVSGECDADEVAEVERIAGLIDAEIDQTGLEHGHVRTQRSFGPIEYRAVAITRAAHARSRAFDSYFGCVEPDAPEEV